MNGGISANAMTGGDGDGNQLVANASGNGSTYQGTQTGQAQSGPTTDGNSNNTNSVGGFSPSSSLANSSVGQYQANSATSQSGAADSAGSVASPKNNLGLTDNDVLAGNGSPSRWVESTIDNGHKTVTVYINANMDTGSLPGADASRLISLASDGVSQFWSRTINLNGEPYAVNVNLAQDDKGMPINLAMNNGSDCKRSFNTDGMVFPANLAGSTIYYQQGGCFGNDASKKDMDFEETAAHEIGHPILAGAGGTYFSATHEGTSSLLGSVTSNTPVTPPTGDLNLMEYYTGGSIKDTYKRAIASESDVKNLIYISTRH
jgi:hypothetical protein